VARAEQQARSFDTRRHQERQPVGGIAGESATPGKDRAHSGATAEHFRRKPAEPQLWSSQARSQRERFAECAQYGERQQTATVRTGTTKKPFN